MQKFTIEIEFKADGINKSKLTDAVYEFIENYLDSEEIDYKRLIVDVIDE